MCSRRVVGAGGWLRPARCGTAHASSASSTFDAGSMSGACYSFSIVRNTSITCSIHRTHDRLAFEHKSENPDTERAGR